MNKATVKLLALLEERGVTPKMIPFELDAIAWQGDICKWVAVYDEDEEAFAVAVYENYLSAEQAIAATLGGGECHIEERNGDWYCDACGEMVGTCDPASELCIDGNAVELWNYCPNCGAKVVSE